ncbi:hypothetical protein BCR42DRAFT_439201 [Absidia repens]|uniref:Uncharacterized protein n=1 Tax=Absidia repens TaxID=90262 RepID=A0A1X2IBK9_9FUNG|nr:hypothetical protein BCR42DRAFT_439201 [Absidia repens]
MASQDIISQLRDLQLAIDDFTDLNSSTHTTSSENYSGQPPSPSSPSDHEDKVLIEEKQTSLLDSVLPFQVESDDFSSLMDQFADIQRTTQSNDTSMLMEKTLLSPAPPEDKAITTTKFTTTIPTTVPHIQKENHGEKHWIQDNDSIHYRRPPPPPPPPPDSPSTSSSIVSRATSTLSMSSRKSTRSYKSIKGKYRSNSSNPKRPVTAKYHARTYDEMMRIPDIHERIQFYDKTYQLCLRADSALASWVNKSKSKGVPKPMLEGYVPPPRPIPSSTSYMSLGRSDSKYFKMNTSLSGSISMILRKGNSANPPQPMSTPKGMSRSFGQQQGLDKTHRLAHSMHWRQDPPTPSFSPAPSLRFKPSSHHLAPLPPRITPMTHPSAAMSLHSSPSVSVHLSSSLSSKKKSSSRHQQYHHIPSSSIPASPSSSVSLPASRKKSKRNGLGFDHMKTPSSSSSSISLSIGRSKKHLGYCRTNGI